MIRILNLLVNRIGIGSDKDHIQNYYNTALYETSDLQKLLYFTTVTNCNRLTLQ